MLSAMSRILAALALAVVATASAAADGVAVRAVVDGDTLILAEVVDGADQVRLVGIQAPKLPLGRPGFQTWPLADEAKRALERMALGRRLTLAFGGVPRDRHGRLLAHLSDEGGLWIQGEMLRLGMARVYTFPDNRARVAEMLAREREARRARRGIWTHPFYAVRRPDGLGRDDGTFQVVEGRVVDAARVRNQVFLNFGDDWRSDFTVRIGADPLRLFRADGADPLALKGRIVRVRGWVRRLNGPLIEATHPEQIETDVERD